jgi:hypothetical protein
MELIEKELTQKVIGAAMEVHGVLGCGLLEGVYQEALEIELGVGASEYFHHLRREDVATALCRRAGTRPDRAGRLQRKKSGGSVEMRPFGAVEESQLLNYLKATGIQVGLLMNFGGWSLEWKRMVF